MRHILLLALSLCVVACSKSKDVANVSFAINFSPSFKQGCIVVRVQDAANASNSAEKTFSGADLAGKTPLKVGYIQRENWGTELKVTVVAHERACDGNVVVAQSEFVVNMAGDGRKPLQSVSLVTPDEDDDGYVAKEAGGTDCADTGPNAAARSPAKSEVCDEIDNDCDEAVDEGFTVTTIYRDADGDGAGAGAALQRCLPATGYATQGGDCDDGNKDIAPGKPEICDNVDNNCVGGVDEGHDKNWYKDLDGDGWLGQASLVVQCAQPDGYAHLPASERFDCNDNNKDTAPGKPELCDNEDNDCDDVVDDGVLNKGDPCNNMSCTGTYVCNLTTKLAECNAAAPRMFYRDADGDGDASSTAPQREVCAGETDPVGYVMSPRTDCDDADPSTKPGAPELCDAIDNNCVGGPDDGLTCNGTLKQVPDFHLRSTNRSWKTVSTGPNGYPVWIAGSGGVLVRRLSAGAKFESFSHGDSTTANTDDGSPKAYASNCGNHDWMASWVDSQGRVVLGGEDGVFALHNGVTTLNCQPSVLPNQPGPGNPNYDITGITGVEVGSDTYVYFTDKGGRLSLWLMGTTQVVLVNPAVDTVRLRGIHALNQNVLLTAGGTVAGTGQRIRAYIGPTGAAGTTQIAEASSATVFANAVWMGATDKACAVGDKGSVWRWDGNATWASATAPVQGGDPVVDFSSVSMRYDKASQMNLVNDQCYMVDASSSGKLKRWTPHGWAKDVLLPAGANVPLRDIAMNPLGNEFWIVGDDSRVFHFPEP